MKKYHCKMQASQKITTTMNVKDKFKFMKLIMEINMKLFISSEQYVIVQDTLLWKGIK